MDLNDPEFYALSLESLRRTRKEIRSLLEEAVKAGELVPCDTARLARTVQVTWNVALIAWAIYRQGPSAGGHRRIWRPFLHPYRASLASQRTRAPASGRRRVARSGHRKP